MKRDRPFSIPLSDAAMAVLEAMRPQRDERHGDLIFPGQKRGQPQSPNTMRANVIRLGVDGTVHGFRSGFTGWAVNVHGAPLEHAQMALGHALPSILKGGEVLEAYLHGLDTVLRPLLQAWGEYLTTAPARRAEAA
jgi:integrase